MKVASNSSHASETETGLKLEIGHEFYTDEEFQFATMPRHICENEEEAYLIRIWEDVW